MPQHSILRDPIFWIFVALLIYAAFYASSDRATDRCAEYSGVAYQNCVEMLNWQPGQHG